MKKMKIYLLIFTLLISLFPISNTHATTNTVYFPDAILTQTNLNGDVSMIQDDVDAPDGNWLTISNASSLTVFEATLDNPSNELEINPTLQKVYALVRKNASGGNNPTVTMTLTEEYGGTVYEHASTSLSLPDGETLLSVSFNAEMLFNTDGSGLGVKITGTPASGGGATKRNVEIGAITFPAIMVIEPLGMPANLRYTPISSTSIQLDWDVVSDATNYIVKRNGVNVYDGLLNRFTDSGLTTPDVYDYEVYAVNSDGNSSSAIKKVPVGLMKKIVALTPGVMSSQTRTDDFENATRTFSFNQSPDYPWNGIPAPEGRTGSVFASQNASVDYSISDFAMNVVGPASISFDYKVSSEESYDYFRFRVNGTPLIETSGEVDWTNFNYTIPSSGSYVLRWEFEKDSSTGNGLDAAMIDNLAITSDLPSAVQVTLPSGNYYLAESVDDVSTVPFRLSIDNGITWDTQTNGLGVFATLTKGQLYDQLVLEHLSPTTKQFHYYYLSTITDSTPPSDVSNLGETHTDSFTNLTWSNPIDADFDHLNIYQNGSLVGTTTSQSYRINGLSLGVSYIFKVAAVDSNGNESDGISISVTTDSVDTTAPNDVSNVRENHSNNSVDLSWLNPTHPDFNLVEVYRDNVLIGTSTNGIYQDIGLTEGSNYVYKLVAVDTNGNKATGVTLLIRTSTLNDWIEIAAGQDHSLAIKNDGSLWSWGDNYYGQLGLGDNGLGTEKLVPTRIGTDTDWKRISTGFTHSLAIKDDGTLWAWGEGGVGQLGIGDGFDYSVPMKVGTDTDWIEVTAGDDFTLATKNDGTLWSWGLNNSGQLGQGNINNFLIPTQVGSDTDWKHVSAGSEFVIATKTDGTLWSWGYNDFYQLGQGDTNTRYSPTQIGSDANWNLVSAGYAFGMAMKTDRTLWSWGTNGDGQLGQGDTFDNPSPEQVGTDANWDKISAGFFHGIAIKTNGTLWSWGLNDTHQLGLADTTVRYSPTKINDNVNWWKIEAGGGHTLSLKTNGTMWGWGENMYGQIGNGTTDEVIGPGPTDTVSPSDISNVVTMEGPTTIDFSWTNPSDMDFDHVNIYRNGILIGSSIDGAFHDSGLESETTYTYKLASVDTSANESTGVAVNATTVSTGELFINVPTADIDFGLITTDGNIQTLSASLNPLIVSDERSSNDGWHISVEATPFTQTNYSVGDTPKTLPNLNFKLNAVSSVTQISGSSVLPAVQSLPRFIDNGAVKVVYAQQNEGIGTFEVSFPLNALELKIDTSDVVVDALNNPTHYESTITWAVNNGP